jgi:hypothetical protein
MKLFFHFDIHYSLFDIYPPIFCGGPVLFSKPLSPYGFIYQTTLWEMILIFKCLIYPLIFVSRTIVSHLLNKNCNPQKNRSFS